MSDDENLTEAKQNIIDKIMSTLGQNFDMLSEEQKKLFLERYEDIERRALSVYNWSFALEYKKLERLLTDESEDYKKYKYIYSLPDDIVKVRELYDSPTYDAPLKSDFVKQGNFIRTNNENIYCEYTKKVDEALFTSEFVLYFSYAMAKEFCYFLTGDDAQLQQLLAIKEAEYLKNAIENESSQNEQKFIIENPFFDVRD
ncbi:MAG: hypothetical protein LBC92_00350 [Rickettsiales bacterium]|jgi:hypothetical protein|nr:hypothetical protein [Rickettsiales bacterium]